MTSFWNNPKSVKNLLDCEIIRKRWEIIKFFMKFSPQLTPSIGQKNTPTIFNDTTADCFLSFFFLFFDYPH